MTIMEDVTKEQIKCIKTMQGAVGEERTRTIVSGCTGGRTDRVSLLKKHEASKVIAEMKRLKQGQGQTKDKEAGAQQMRLKLIAMSYTRAGLQKKYATEAQKKAVIGWLDGWCHKYGYLHKGLNDYTYEELTALVTQFKNVLDSLIIKL